MKTALKERVIYIVIFFSKIKSVVMIAEELLNELTEDDLPEHYRIVAETCGMDVAKTLIKELGGLQILIPNPRKMTCVKRFVVKNKDRYTVQTMARGIGISERAIYNIIK